MGVDEKNEDPSRGGLLQPGQNVAHFRILELIGRGGMGAVYKAHDTQLGRPVALKTVSQELLCSDDAIARFRQEAQSAALVDHANVVQIYSVGVDRKLPYIAMEYLRGESLADRISQGALPVSEAIDVILPVCSGVFAANHRGILHRDLKPANIFLSRGFTGMVPKVLDFGLAKLATADPKNARLTASGLIMGTLLYISPEHVMDLELDARADQYALAVVLYECLTGHTPHENKSPHKLFSDLMSGKFTVPSFFRTDLPDGLERVILRALNHQRDERYFDMRAFGRALLPFASSSVQNRWTEHYQAPSSAFAELELSRSGHDAFESVTEKTDPELVLPRRVAQPTERLQETKSNKTPLHVPPTKLIQQQTRLLAQPTKDREFSATLSPPADGRASPISSKPRWSILVIGSLAIGLATAATLFALKRASTAQRAATPTAIAPPATQVQPPTDPQAQTKTAAPSLAEPIVPMRVNVPVRPSNTKPRFVKDEKPTGTKKTFYTPDGVPVF